ncbi:MAG: rRNA maturation RNase YbeY [Bacteroidaceae bacterium]|nr:rRNA maturation RNase YbeY [Bacteroidaceae bacterium]
MSINFNVERIDFPPIDVDKVSRWIERVAASYDKRCGNISYVFCDDEHILEVNKAFLQHDYYTDIITFDYSVGRIISGDVFISVDTVMSNAQGLGVSYDSELLRVIIHGVLHLCGIDDKGPGEREIMERCENEALACF